MRFNCANQSDMIEVESKYKASPVRLLDTGSCQLRHVRLNVFGSRLSLDIKSPVFGSSFGTICRSIHLPRSHPVYSVLFLLSRFMLMSNRQTVVSYFLLQAAFYVSRPPLAVPHVETHPRRCELCLASALSHCILRRVVPRYHRLFCSVLQDMPLLRS